MKLKVMAVIQQPMQHSELIEKMKQEREIEQEKRNELWLETRAKEKLNLHKTSINICRTRAKIAPFVSSSRDEPTKVQTKEGTFCPMVKEESNLNAILNKANLEIYQTTPYRLFIGFHASTHEYFRSVSQVKKLKAHQILYELSTAKTDVRITGFKRKLQDLVQKTWIHL